MKSKWLIGNWYILAICCADTIAQLWSAMQLIAITFSGPWEGNTTALCGGHLGSIHSIHSVCVCACVCVCVCVTFASVRAGVGVEGRERRRMYSLCCGKKRTDKFVAGQKGVKDEEHMSKHLAPTSQGCLSECPPHIFFFSSSSSSSFFFFFFFFFLNCHFQLPFFFRTALVNHHHPSPPPQGSWPAQGSESKRQWPWSRARARRLTRCVLNQCDVSKFPTCGFSLRQYSRLAVSSRLLLTRWSFLWWYSLSCELSTVAIRGWL